MRDVKYTARFRRDYKREKYGRHGNKLDTLLMEVVDLLAADTPLPHRNPANGTITVIATSARISF
jgi:mRNA interferase YafQ